jgi:general secretion pathway protein M
MIEGIRLWWAAHSPRDRFVISILGLAVVMVIGWLGVWQPLVGAVDSMRESQAVAVERHAGIAARVDEYLALQARGARPAASSATRLDLILSQSAAEQGFTLSHNNAVGDNQASIAIASATAPALFTWLGTLETQGILSSELSIRPNANGTVALTATLRRVQ